MKRYRLTTSGVCDCMLRSDDGEWVRYNDAAILQSALEKVEILQTGYEAGEIAWNALQQVGGEE